MAARVLLAAALAGAAVAQEVCKGTTNLYSGTVELIDGSSFDLASLAGNVTVLTNVASFWGETVSYYNGFKALRANITAPDFKILGQPCNQFGGQEPGNGMEIPHCVQYVRPGMDANGAAYAFPDNFIMTQKGDVNGFLATALAKAAKDACGGADVLWNFEMWTISKTGQPYKRYLTGFGPMNVAGDVEHLLAQ